MGLILYTHAFLSSLVFTCAVETAVLFVLVRFVFKNPNTTGDIIFAGLFASFATIGYVWYVFPVMVHWPAGSALLWGEGFAFVVEAVFYRFFLRLSWRDAFVVSLVANAVSFFGGRALRAAGLWVRW